MSEMETAPQATALNAAETQANNTLPTSNMSVLKYLGEAEKNSIENTPDTYTELSGAEQNAFSEIMDNNPDLAETFQQVLEEDPELAPEAATEIIEYFDASSNKSNASAMEEAFVSPYEEQQFEEFTEQYPELAALTSEENEEAAPEEVLPNEEANLEDVERWRKNLRKRFEKVAILLETLSTVVDEEGALECEAYKQELTALAGETNANVVFDLVELEKRVYGMRDRYSISEKDIQEAGLPTSV